MAWNSKEMHRNKFIFLLVCPTIFFGCSNNNKINAFYANEEKAKSFGTVSMKELLGKPDFYKDRIIETTGFYRTEIEESALYKDKNSFVERESHNSLWITFNVGYPLLNNTTGVNLFESYQEVEKLNGKKIKIRGKFNPRSKGHLAMFSGSIENVFYIEVLR